MKKILSNSTYLTMLIGVAISIVSFLTFIFVNSTIYFTIAFIINIVTNFAVIGYNMLKYDNESQDFKSASQSGYLLVTLFFLIMDIVLISNLWDMDVYTNVMYVSNIKLYLIVYSLFVLAVISMNLYATIKEHTNRQNSTKVTTNDKK